MILSLRLLIAGVALSIVAAYGDGSPAGGIVRLDPRLDFIISRDAMVERVAEGFDWVEGPVWDRSGYLLFSDIPNNSVFRLRPGGLPELFLKPSGYSGTATFAGREPGSNGLTFDAQGRLVLCQHGDRRIARLEADGTMTTLADRFQDRRLNSPNDLVYRSNGDLYFTDPPFGLPRTFDDPTRELDFCGVYRLRPDGELMLLTRDIEAPNGIAFSPDQRTLYVTDVGARRPAWLAYDVRADGSIASGRVFVDAATFVRTRKGAPDGLKVDRNGNVFAAGPGGLYVFAPDGSQLGFVDLGVATANCAWGEDGSVLYITAGSSIHRLRTKTKGAGF